MTPSADNNGPRFALMSAFEVEEPNLPIYVLSYPAIFVTFPALARLGTGRRR